MSEEDKLFFGAILSAVVGIAFGLLVAVGIDYIGQRRTDNYCQTVSLEQMDRSRCGL